MVWRFHSEADASGGASGGNLSSSKAVNADHGREPSSSSAAGGHGVVGGNAAFITMDDLVQDMAEGGAGDEDGDSATVMEPEDVELFEEIMNR